MNIKFKQMYAKNFLSFKELTFDFERFDSQTILISGQNNDISGDNKRSNGSGKSSLNNILVFAIYGETLNPLKKTQNIRNWSATVKDAVEVSLAVETNGVQYSIQRILKGAKCTSELRVFKRQSSDDDWVDISLSTIAETQKMIETDIVPCGKEGFLRCVILAADQNYNFFKLNKAAKNSFFEGLFELTVYSDMYNRLHRKTLDENATLIAHSKTIDSLNENISRLKKDMEESKKNQSDIEEINRKIDIIKKDISDFDKTNDIESIKSSNVSELEEFKKLSVEKMKSKLKEFDEKNYISSVDSNGIISFDVSNDDKIVGEKIREFDKLNGISNVDDNGIIIFDNIIDNENEKNTLSERITKGRNMISDLEKQIGEYKSEMSELNCENKNCEKTISNMNLTIKTHSKITDILCDDCLPKYKDSVKISDYDGKISSLRDVISKNIKKIEELSKIISTSEKKLITYKDGLQTIELSLSKLKEREIEERNNRMLLQSKRDMAKKKYTDELLFARKSLQSERNSFRNELRSEYNSIISEKTNELNRKVMTLENERNVLCSKLNNETYRLNLLMESKTKSYEVPIASLTESLEETKNSFNASNDILSHYKALESVLKPDNIRKLVVTDMLKDLNYRINGYLSKMGSNYTCRFDEDFDATFTSSTGKEAEYNNFSSGEKMRLSIACCMAFKDFMQVRLNLHPNILIIDEYIDSNIDEMAVSGIMDMINYMVGTEKISAFIISHRSEIRQNNFDSDIFVKKKDNCSTVYIDGQPIN